jgi:dTDP-4-dehydrorhamnose reductase
VNVYGKSKLAGEEAVLDSGAEALVVRTAWLYAPDGRNFSNTMLRLMRERREVRVVADQIGTPTSCASLAAALWKMIELGSTGIQHFTNAGVASWYDFAVAIGEEGQVRGLVDNEVSVKPISTRDYPTPARRPPFSVLDCDVTWGSLGGPPPHWRQALREALARVARPSKEG